MVTLKDRSISDTQNDQKVHLAYYGLFNEIYKICIFVCQTDNSDKYETYLAAGLYFQGSEPAQS